MRANCLRARPFILRIRLCPDPVGDRACAARALAVDRFHAMDCAADFPAATRGVHPSRRPVLVAAAAACTRPAADTTRPSTPGSA